MDVRLARPTDVPLALALALDDGAHLVRTADRTGGRQVARTMARACFPVASPGRAWIARATGSVALLEAAPRRYVIGWDVTRLVARGDRADVLGPALNAVTEHLQSHGVPRLFARCAESAAEELKMVGFHPLSREYVLRRPGSQPSCDASLPADSRYRMPQDAWPLHQLENSLTPTLVRQMEGLTSLDWSPKARGMQEIVVERDGEVVCWLGWGVKLRKDLQQIGLLVHPRYAELAPDLLAYAQRNSPGIGFLARVRDYHSEALTAFLATGFEIVAEEILMVKHARVERARNARSLLAVAQVPTAHILRQHAGDTARLPR